MTVYNIETLKSERNSAGLIEALKHPDDASARRAAAEALGQIDDPQATPALVDALRDQDEGVRTAVIEALGKVGDADTFAMLTPLIAEPDDAVRAAVFAAIIRIKQGAKWKASAGNKRTARSDRAAEGGQRRGIGDWFYAAACLPAEHIKMWYANDRRQILAARIGLFVGGAILWVLTWAILSTAFRSSSSSTESIGTLVSLVPVIGLFALAMKGWDWYSQYKFGTVGNFIKVVVTMIIMITVVGMLLIAYWTGKGAAKMIFRE